MFHSNETNWNWKFKMNRLLKYTCHSNLEFSWKQQVFLYSWRFARYSAPIHWLVHGHMTSNDETFSRQLPWAGNIAKIWRQTGNSSLLPAKYWPLFSNFAFVLFCYITNHLMTGPLGNSEFCFPLDQSLSVNCYTSQVIYVSWLEANVSRAIG